ncbi:MAG: transposase [Bacteroidetes bacterium]|nr:MAG: transposase [Bacteroidota bacterium]
MILSHQKKFIFVHIYKVAGSSIRSVLSKYDDRDSSDLSIFNNSRIWMEQKFFRTETSFLTHLKAREIQKMIKEVDFNNYFKFSFVRNPWDWQVSLYYFMMQSTNHRQHKLVSKMKNFEEYLDWRINKDLDFQKHFVCDSKGKLLVDFVGRFENIQADFDHICDRIYIPRFRLPVKNTSNHLHYKEYYTSKTRKWVEEAFKEDIELFGYEF